MMKTFLALFFLLSTSSAVHAQWTEVPGFSGKSLTALAVKDTCLYVGSDADGIFRSYDHGATWIRSNVGLTQMGIHSICATTTHLYTGTFSGVFKSVNRGDIWEPAGLAGTIIEDVIGVGPYLLAATNTGVYRSTDHGATWTEKNSGLTNTVMKAFFFHDSLLFASTWYEEGGIFLSRDSGATWSVSNAGLTNMDVSAFARVADTIFAATNGGGIFRSFNRGTRWEACNTGMGSLRVGDLASIGTNLFATTWGGGIFHSTNSGSTWNAVNTGLTNLYLATLMFDGSKLLIGTYGSGLVGQELGSLPVVYDDSVTIPIHTGWNLVSSPVLPGSATPSAVFAHAMAVFGYSTFEPGYVNPAHISAGAGYWELAVQPGSEFVRGFQQDSVSITVPKAGWTLFGSSIVDRPVSHLTSVPGGSITGSIFGYNTLTSSYESAAQIVPGKGYWVYVTQPCRLVLK